MFTEEYIINVYCLVYEMLKKVIKNSIRQRGSAPNLSDAEVITMEIAGESLGIDQDKKIHRIKRGAIASRSKFAYSIAGQYER